MTLGRHRYEGTMYWDVKLVKPLPEYRIYVETEDGHKGVFDLKPYLNHGVQTLMAEMIPVESLPSEAHRPTR